MKPTVCVPYPVVDTVSTLVLDPFLVVCFGVALTGDGCLYHIVRSQSDLPIPFSLLYDHFIEFVTISLLHPLVTKRVFVGF
jgi:hypothetical protein